MRTSARDRLRPKRKRMVMLGDAVLRGRVCLDCGAEEYTVEVRLKSLSPLLRQYLVANQQN